MKSFKQMLKEYYFGQTEDPRTPMEKNADQHVYDMVEMDQKFRSENPTTRTFPLEYDGHALTAIRNYYLAVKDPKNYPQHVQNMKSYMDLIKRSLPHLSNHIHPKY